jgi:hypothetical protein
MGRYEAYLATPAHRIWPLGKSKAFLPIALAAV